MKSGYILVSVLGLGCNVLGGTSVSSLEAEVHRLRAEQERQSAQIEQLQNRVALTEDTARVARSTAESTRARLVVRLGGDGERAEPIRFDHTERPQAPEDPAVQNLPVARITATRGDRIPESSTFVVHESDRLPVVPVPPPPHAPSANPMQSSPPSPNFHGATPATPLVPAGAPQGRNERTLPPMGTLDPEAVRVYDEALAMARGERCEQAIEAFSSFLSHYPEHPHADNAVYWRAECILHGGDRHRALMEFEALVARYPSGNKVPDALYKIAVIHRRLGAREASEHAAQRLLNEFPDSDAARRMRAER